MPIESISIMYIVVGLLLVVLFGRVLQFIVERAASLFVGKEQDAVDLLRIELNALNIKIDALKFSLDALKIELNAFDGKLESTAKMTEQLSIVPASQTISQGVLEDTWWRGNGEGEFKQEDMWPRAKMEGQSAHDDTWTRDAHPNDTSVVPTIGEPTANDTWTRVADSKSVAESSASRAAAAFSSGNAKSPPMGMRAISPRRGRALKG